MSGARILRAAGVLSLVAGGVLAGYLARPVLAAAPTNAAAGSPPLVALAAQQVGVRRCLPAINAVAQRGVAGATMQDIVINWDHDSPDGSPFFSLTGLGAGERRAALSITTIPTAKGGCSVLVERVSSSAASCKTVAERQLGSAVGALLIDGILVYQSKERPEETFTLVQNTENCTIIRRQAAFEWPPRK
ncbi:hypothetical protein [Tsuneonella suprasediminis]|uniref:hypothetical protein n=1 Tax=Tsuneonella suprasediminis TaxID=2306996 RepID=UPI002F9302C3